MDEFIKAQLDGIEMSSNIMAQEAQNINMRITAIFGYCEGRRSEYEIIHPALEHIYDSNGYQGIIIPKTLIEEIKEMMIELKIKGSVRERSNGLIELRTQAFGSIYGRSKEDIEEKLTRRLKEDKKCKKATVKIKAPLLSEFFITDYLPYKERQGRSKSSIAYYHRYVALIKAQKFDKPLNLYTSRDIENFLYSIPETRKRQIVQGFLNNLFNRALALSLIKTNPCTPVERPVHHKEQGKAFSFDEQKEFFEILMYHESLTYRQKCYFIFVYLIGARRNEALGVKVEDVDFKNKVLSIHGTKTEGSDRQVPLTPLVEKLLLSLGVSEGRYFDMSDKTVNTLFREKIWEKRKGHKPHDLRHTFGTIQVCVEKIDIKTVSLWLGHSTIDTTLSIYTHPEQLDRGN